LCQFYIKKSFYFNIYIYIYKIKKMNELGYTFSIKYERK
jgi:hypothetical protein